jgi:D-alanyl-D-alanine carboxypeptidase (penicillin-binding protein 5/6)
MDYLEHTDKKRDATMLANTNKLLGKYEGLDGIKTGFHQKAGYCFASTARRGDFRLISVVLNAENSNQRFEDTVKLLDYGFGHFNSVMIVKKGSAQKNIPVEKGMVKEVNLIADCDLSILTEKGKESGINTKIEVPDKLFAPLRKGQVVGKLIAEQDGKKIGEVNLVVSEDVKKASMLDMIKRVLERWFSF